MTRSQLDHVLRATGAIAREDLLVVVGSQAILASHPSPSAELVASIEVDLFPLEAPHKADLKQAGRVSPQGCHLCARAGARTLYQRRGDEPARR